MDTRTFEALLDHVEQPSQYLGTEINRILKDTADLRMALAFPDAYTVGMSHFGLQILYHLLNREPGIAAERVFAPAADMEALLREKGVPLFSLESRKPLNQLDLIGFSLLYELNYTNVLLMLDLSGIPFLAADRSDDHPVIIAGGPCTCNPEPVAALFDAMVIGDGEEVVPQMVRIMAAWKQTGAPKSALLDRWQALTGVYIPSQFEIAEDPDTGMSHAVPLSPAYSHVDRAIVADLNQTDFPDAPLLPYGKPVHDRLRLEVSRGCTRGCRFCQAGILYRPVRERSVKGLMDLAKETLKRTGYEDISLLSLSTGDYCGLTELMTRLMGKGTTLQAAYPHTAVSLPSVRAGTLTPELMTLIRGVRKTGFTIAPEAGTQRLRDVINKGITEAEILDTVTNAFALGWRIIKLYFMIGLPTETDADLDGIVQLAETLRQQRPRGGKPAQVTVSVTPFIPKPHAPFQWAPQISLEESRRRIFYLKNAFASMKGVGFKWQDPKSSQLEGVWARGDRRLTPLLIRAYEKGCRFDGWSDRFRYDLWMEAFADTGIDPYVYAHRPRDLTEPLPWDHIHVGTTRAFLKSEWMHAMAGETTPDCRFGDCSACGVCDFDTLAPRLKSLETPPALEPATPSPSSEDVYRDLMLIYTKTGPARYVGHLELMTLFARALRRIHLPVRYTQGFHPKPRLGFDDPLPIGMESDGERCFISIPVHCDVTDLKQTLSQALPEGIRIQDVKPAPPKKRRFIREPVTYSVTGLPEGMAARAVQRFVADGDQVWERTRGKGKTRRIPLASTLTRLAAAEDGTLTLCLKPVETVVPRPVEVIAFLLGLEPEDLYGCRVRKHISAPGLET
ncbi:MAG: B12-binding domain-containing radical SAM protein [Deltaproteobacteria bacterium]|nr:MAG: B12-binding domain-containing radical SAM protein [Deltaproteobacteria bacterium]